MDGKDEATPPDTNTCLVGCDAAKENSRGGDMCGESTRPSTGF